MRMSEKCRNNNTDNLLASRRTGGGKNTKIGQGLLCTYQSNLTVRQYRYKKDWEFVFSLNNCSYLNVLQSSTIVNDTMKNSLEVCAKIQLRTTLIWNLRAPLYEFCLRDVYGRGRKPTHFSVDPPLNGLRNP